MQTKVQSIIHHWRLADTVSALDIHKMLGTIQYMVPLVPRGRLRFRLIQRWVTIRRLGWENYNLQIGSSIICPCGCLQQCLRDCHSRSKTPILRSSQMHPPMDGGLNWATTVSVGPKLKLQNHINILEMEAVYCAVHGYLNRLHGWVVCLMCDYATVVSYIKQEGGTRSYRLTRLTKFSITNALSLCRSICRDAAIFRQTACLDQDRHYPPNRRSIRTYYGQCSTVGDSLGSICLPHSTTSAISSYLRFQISLRRCSVDPVEPDGQIYAFPTVIAKLRLSQSITMILIAPYRMDASWMPELLQLP